MILLIEGVNCCGKSTLAKQFSEDLNWPILKFNVPPYEAFDYFWDEICHWGCEEDNFIIDRCHLSNWAYENLLEGGVLSLDDWTVIDQTLKKMNTWLFLLVDDPFAIEARLQQREDKGDGANQLHRHVLAQIQQRFIEASGMSRIEQKGHFTLMQLLDPETGEPTSHYYQILEQILRESDG